MKPEDILAAEWERARKRRDTAKDAATRRAFYVMADALQYLLQDYSPYGHSLVWSARRGGTNNG